MINKFSVSSMLESRKNREEEKKENSKYKKYRRNNEKLDDHLLAELLDMGLELNNCLLAYSLYKYKSVEEALFIMLKDQESGLYLHQFIPDDHSLCKICNQKRNDHNNAFNENLFSNLNTDEKQVLILKDDIKSNTNKTVDYNPINKESLPRGNLLNENPKQRHKLDEELVRHLENPNLCIICYDNIVSSQDLKFNCQHKICLQCVVRYLEFNIQNGNVIYTYLGL